MGPSVAWPRAEHDEAVAEPEGRSRGHRLQRSQHFGNDQQLCDFLVTQLVLLAFPYGWKTDETCNELLDTGATSTRRWWSIYGNLPYLESYRPEGAWETDSQGDPPGLKASERRTTSGLCGCGRRAKVKRMMDTWPS